MDGVRGQLHGIGEALAKNKTLRNWVIAGVAVFFVLQLYFVRELIAAELLFLMLFAVLFTLGAIFYLLGSIGERGLDWGETGVRVIAQSARRGYVIAEEVSRKALRNRFSESTR